MLSLRSRWISALIAVLILVGSWHEVAACGNPAPLTVTQGQGTRFSGIVEPSNGEAWQGYVTITFTFDGEVYTFAFDVDVPEGSVVAWSVLLTGNGTLNGASACEDPGGGTESPDPVAGIVKNEQEP